MRRITGTLLVLNLVATVVAAGWALLHLVFGGMVLYDTNLETFLHALSPEQRTAIVQTAEGLLRGAVVPLLATSGLWAVLSVALYFSRDGTADTREPAPAAGPREGSG